jgi:1,2-diacylglycerol-3-alpha-glucose alpha-1,2-glucosyltransferase
MITGQKNIQRYLNVKNLGGMGTQAPTLKRELEKRGHEVFIDGKGRDYDVMHYHTPLVNPLLVHKVRQEGTPIVIHARHIPELVLDSFKGARLLYGPFVRYSKWYYNKADVVICATPYVIKVLMELGARSEIRLIPNSINRERFRPDPEAGKRFREAHGIKDDEIVALSVGLRIGRKGIFSFIEAAKQLNSGKYRFLWVGKGEIGLNVVEEGKDWPENVELIDFVPFEQMNGVYNGADMFLFPTYAESYGNVLFEAAAAGKPIILRDIPVYEDWFRSGENCLKFRTDGEFAGAIERLACENDLHQKLGQNSLKLAEDHDLNKAIDSLCGVYESLTRRQNPGGDEPLTRRQNPGGDESLTRCDSLTRGG